MIEIYYAEDNENISRTDVFTVLTLVADNLRELFAESNISVDIPEAGEMMINVDFDWTMEAVMNLLKNCMEHTSSGGVVHCFYEQNPLYTQILSDLQRLIGVQSSVAYQKATAKRVIKEDEISAGLRLSGILPGASNTYVSITDGAWTVNAPILILDDTSRCRRCGEGYGYIIRNSGVVLHTAASGFGRGLW